MNTDEREQVKARILEEMEITREAIAGQEDAGQAVAPDNAIGRISRMDAMYGKQVNDAALQRTREKLAKLEYALAQFDTPKFACCEFCGQPIAVPRILAMPESTTCMHCAAFV